LIINFVIPKIKIKMAKKSTTPKPTTGAHKMASGTKAKKPVASKKTAASPGTSRKRTPTYEEISSKAHEIYLERIAKGEPGNPDSDWHKALEILKK
jgi:hypothetical protein